MSWQATNWARTQTTNSVGAKTVLLLLADLADEQHSCFPGQARLSADSEQDERTVRRHLVRLEKLGLIRREHRYDSRGKRTSDRFFLAVDGLFDLPADQAIPPAGGDGDSPLPDRMTGSESGSTTGQSDPPLPDKSSADYRTPVSREQLEEPPVGEGGALEPDVAAPCEPDSPTPPPAESISTPAPPAAGLGWDEFGPTQPYCPEHPPWEPDVPCHRCRKYRELFPAAERTRAVALEKAAADAAAAMEKAMADDPANQPVSAEQAREHAERIRSELRRRP